MIRRRCDTNENKSGNEATDHCARIYRKKLARQRGQILEKDTPDSYHKTEKDRRIHESNSQPSASAPKRI